MLCSIHTHSPVLNSEYSIEHVLAVENTITAWQHAYSTSMLEPALLAAPLLSTGSYAG